MKVLKKKINLTYKKSNGLWVLDLNKRILPNNFIPKEQSVVYLPPLKVGGNHKHPRTEIFIGIGDLELIWLDEKGIKKTELLNFNSQNYIFVVLPFTPHAVVNKSKNNFGILIEWADAKQHEVISENIIK